jgi:hypothetical protein
MLGLALRSVFSSRTYQHWGIILSIQDTLVPRIQENDEIDISAARWVLVIEKEVWMRLIDQLFAHEVPILTEASRQYSIDSCEMITTSRPLLAKAFS